MKCCRDELDVEDVCERHARRWHLDVVSDHDVDEAAHYCRYAFAAYGYLLYIWAQPQYKSALYPLFLHPFLPLVTPLSPRAGPKILPYSLKRKACLFALLKGLRCVLLGLKA